MRLVLLSAVVMACSPRELVLGEHRVVTSPVDAGVGLALKEAAAPPALDEETCTRFVSLQVPGRCFGGSGPSPSQCLIAHYPDGGLHFVAALDRSDGLAIRRVLGVNRQQAFVEVAEWVDFDAGVEVRSYLLSGTGEGRRHLVLPRDAQVLAGHANEVAADAVACERSGCSLYPLPLDGTPALTPVTGVPRPFDEVLTRSIGGALAWRTDAGVTWVGTQTRTASPDRSGQLAFDGEALLVTNGETLSRLEGDETRVLATDLASPRGLFVVGGHVIVVEARRVRAFPLGGGTPLRLYQLTTEPGELRSPRLVSGRLVFDQACLQRVQSLVHGNVELDLAVGRARWLNAVPGYPFVDGANSDALGNVVAVSSELLLRLID